MHEHFSALAVIYENLISNMNVSRSLQWLRGANKNVELELDTIRSNIRASRFKMDNNMNGNLSSLSHNGLPMKYSFKSIVKNVKSVLKNTRLVKPILVTCGLMIFQRFTGESRGTCDNPPLVQCNRFFIAGANSFGFYAVKIFRQTFSGMNPHGGYVSNTGCRAFVQQHFTFHSTGRSQLGSCSS